jgi:hypothetical protein
MTVRETKKPTDVGNGHVQLPAPAPTNGRVTAEDHAMRGRAARAEVPRSSHAVWEPSGDRRDPIDQLQEQGKSRVPELLPIRYGRMLVSPFTFFRGTAYLMAADPAISWRGSWPSAPRTRRPSAHRRPAALPDL